MNINLLKHTQRFNISEGYLKGRHATIANSKGNVAFACMRSYSGRRVFSYDAPGVPVMPSIVSTVHPDYPRVKAIGYTLKQAIKTHALCVGKELA